jgi:Questin oxidase-like
LLDRAQAYAPEYGGSLSTHLPMALVSLQALGATASRMEAFFATISARLNAAPPTAAASDDWLSLRGDRAAFASVRAYFLQAIADHGRDAVLRQALPSLVDGVGAVAFHGLLRTASATVAGHDAELASGLAVWACGHLPLASFVATQPPEASAAGVADWLAHMAAHGDAWRVDTGMITPQMRAFVRTPAFRDGADRLAVHGGTLRELAAQALAIYLRTRNFTVLHLITSAHALRVLMPWLDEPLVAVRHYARAYAAGLAASGVKVDAPIIPVNVLPWPEVLREGAASNDEHVIKLVYACREDWKVTGEAGYQRAASLAVAA